MVKPIATARGALLGLVVLGLSACADTSVGDVLGLEKSPPDEFAVVSRAPLSLPPDFGLRPPQPGAARPQDTAPSEAAQAALFGREARQRMAQQMVLERADKSPGEIAFLEQADAFGIEPDIRRIVDEESAVLARADDSFIDTLLFWQEPAPPGVVVDATEETRRLQENQSLGRSPVEGETPMIRRQSEDRFINWPF